MVVMTLQEEKAEKAEKERVAAAKAQADAVKKAEKEAEEM